MVFSCTLMERESCAIDYDINIFSTNAAIRAWVGLRAI